MSSARYTKKSLENYYTLHDYEIVSEVPGDECDMQQYAINKLARLENIEEEAGLEEVESSLEAFLNTPYIRSILNLYVEVRRLKGFNKYE